MNNKIESGLLKWAGGKERELKLLKQKFPKYIKNYYEPFVGGGSVFINTDADKYYINDLYDELYEFYLLITNNNQDFKKNLLLLNDLWIDTTDFFKINADILSNFINLRHTQINNFQEILTKIIDKFYKDIYIKKYSSLSKIDIDFNKIFIKTITNKIKRIVEHENKKGILSIEDLEDNFKSAFKSGIYTYIRSIYNTNRVKKYIDKTLYLASFYFIRNYCYASMFRYNKKGEFNVPYGGLSYNENYLDKKINHIYTQSNINKYSITKVNNLDFEVFLNNYKYGKNDFIFLDPPYDSEFSDYANNYFTKLDQQRLANILLKIQAKWLLIIKKTAFIESLYSNPKVKIESFEKKYQVNFKNRNDKNVEHLIITNY